jgi:hypothetical protein
MTGPSYPHLVRHLVHLLQHHPTFATRTNLLQNEPVFDDVNVKLYVQQYAIQQHNDGKVSMAYVL